MFLIVVLSLVLLVSLGAMGFEFVQYHEGTQSYETAQELSGLPDLSAVAEEAEEESEDAATGTDVGGAVWADPYADALRNMDFTALREKNSDVLGWIFVPNSVISYPLVYGSGKEDTYYLNHTWSGDYGIVGAIFVEPANSSDFSNFNTVIYGHNMNNGSMFGSLKSYKSQSYWKSHKNVYITTDSGARCYQVFAAYEVSTAGDTYKIGFSSDKSKHAFIDYCLSKSVISTGVKPAAGDSIITLSTCTGRGHATRWVVQAVLKNQVAAAPAVSAAPTPSPTPAPEVTTQPEATIPADTQNVPEETTAQTN